MLFVFIGFANICVRSVQQLTDSMSGVAWWQRGPSTPVGTEVFADEVL